MTYHPKDFYESEAFYKITLTDIAWIAAGFSIVGTFLNAYMNILCWPVWILGSMLWVYYSIKTEQKAQSILWLWFVGFDVFGWYKWSVQ